MTSVVPSTSAMSVITAPAAIRKPAEPASSATACHAMRRECARAWRQTIAPVHRPSAKCGTRAPHSLMPNSFMPAAVAQKDRTGLPQKGWLSVNQGTIQSARSTMRRPMSA